MPINQFRRSLIVLGVLGFLVGPFSASAAQAADITVFAAASLKNALDDAAKLYETKTGDKVNISYGASSALAKQIEAGAPADIFFLPTSTGWIISPTTGQGNGPCPP